MAFITQNPVSLRVSRPLAGNTMGLRQTIEKRLAAFRIERRRLQVRLNFVTEIEKEYELLLAEADQMTLSPRIEESGSVKLSEIVKAAAEEDESTNAKLKEFLLAHLALGALSLEELLTLAHGQGFNFGVKSPARVLHFNLLNLKNSGLIEKEGDKWNSVRNQTA